MDPTTQCDNVFVFLDISFGNVKVGRIVIELFKNVAPKTVENFRALCTGEKGLGKFKKPLHYKGCRFHRIVPQCFAQSGDIINNDGTGGESIYSETFQTENYELLHDKEGMVGMATIANSNVVNSQFYITAVPCGQLDGTNIAFGVVRKGLDIVKEMSAIDSSNDVPIEDIVISDCGELKKGEPWNLHVVDETQDIYPPWPSDWDGGHSKSDIEKAITTIIESGNHYFLRRNFALSQMKYLTVLRYISWYENAKVGNDENFIKNCKSRTLLNLAAVKLKRKCYKDALSYCNQCETIDSSNGKLYYRRAQARLGMRDIDEALQDVRKALILLPDNKMVQNFLRLAKLDKLSHLKKEREFFGKVFKSS